MEKVNQITEKLTRQRAAVLAVVRENHGHLTANEIFEAARVLLPTISFATVYNSLRYLRDEGLIGEISFGSHASRYDRETERHDHAICVDCGKLVDFDLALPTELIKAAAAHCKFTPQSVHLTLRGVCAECRKHK